MFTVCVCGQIKIISKKLDVHVQGFVKYLNQQLGSGGGEVSPATTLVQTFVVHRDGILTVIIIEKCNIVQYCGL